MGDYHMARLYMSQREDGSRNWIGNAQSALESIQQTASLVESLGVANGSGTINMARVGA